jgi:hypothetical protein
MSFDDTYRESIQSKHLSNVGFTSTAKGITNEGFTPTNPHQILASQIPIVDVVTTYGIFTASGIAAGQVEEHVVKLTADPTVNNNKAWLAYENNCTTSGHSSRGSIRVDQWMRYPETEYKLRVFSDNGAGTAPDYADEILPSETAFNWEYDAAAGTLYFDDDPSSHGYTLPLWGKFYKYIGEVISDKIDTTVSGASRSFTNITDGTNTAVADNADDTLTFDASGGLGVFVDSTTKTVTISGAPVVEQQSNNMTYNSGTWEYNGSFTSIPDDLEVFYNGVKNKDGDADYYTTTISGGILKVNFGFNTYDTDWVNIVYGSSTTYPGELRDWELHTSAYTALNRDRVMLDSTGGAYTITMPANPTLGWTVAFLDAGGLCGTNNVTVGRNGKNIQGIAQDMTIDTDEASFEMIYYNTSRGWVLNE